MRPLVARALNERRRRTAAKVKGRWGQGFFGERLPDYRVVITTSGPSSRKKHTFILVADNEADPDTPLHWERVTETFRCDDGIGGRLLVSLSEPLPEKVNLAKSVDVPGATLMLVFDALVSGGRHRIDLADINRIVSQLGSRIARFDTLPPEQRRIAEPALYTENLARLL